MDISQIKLEKKAFLAQPQANQQPENIVEKLTSITWITNLEQASDVLIVKAPLSIDNVQWQETESCKIEVDFILSLKSGANTIFKSHKYLKHVHEGRAPVSHFYYDKRILLSDEKRSFKFNELDIKEAIKIVIKSIPELALVDIDDSLFGVHDPKKNNNKVNKLYFNKSCFEIIVDILNNRISEFKYYMDINYIEEQERIEIKKIDPNQAETFNFKFYLNEDNAQRNLNDYISKPLRRVPIGKAEANDITLPGDLKAKAGKLITINEPVTGMIGPQNANKNYLITHATHTIEKGIHLMKLGLASLDVPGAVPLSTANGEYLRLKTIQGSLKS